MALSQSVGDNWIPHAKRFELPALFTAHYSLSSSHLKALCRGPDSQARFRYPQVPCAFGEMSGKVICRPTLRCLRAQGSAEALHRSALLDVKTLLS